MTNNDFPTPAFLEQYDALPRPFTRGQAVTVAGIVGTVISIAPRAREVEIRFEGGADWYSFDETTPAPRVVDHAELLDNADWDTASLETRDRNANLKPEIENRCRMCNRPVVGASFSIHEHESGALFPVAIADVDESGAPLEGDWGWHDIGPSCAKKLPAKYRAKNAAAS